MLEGITKIGNNAFYGCDSLKNVTLPKSIELVGVSAFQNCTSISDVWYAGSESDRTEITILNNNAELSSATWHCS